jgi:tetratricopeptide (TPR) repeat protein
MAAHLNREELEAYQRRALAAGDLLAASRHVAECRECAARLRANMGSAGVARLAAEDDDEGHLSYEQIEAYVDERISTRERAEVDAHVHQCRDCASDLEDVREFAAQMRVRPEARVTWRERVAQWLHVPPFAMAGSAAAVALVLTASFLLIHKSQPQSAAEIAAVRPPEPAAAAPEIPAELAPDIRDLSDTHRDAVVSVLRGESQTAVTPDDDAIEQARRKDPNAHLVLGALYQQRGMWAEAEREYRLLLDAHPHSEKARKLWENAHKHAQAGH